MKGSLGRLVAVAALASILAAPACGSSRADPGPAVASCNAYCNAYAAAACADPIYATADDCKGYECSDIATSPDVCFAKFKAFYDCSNALSVAALCADMSCQPQLDALLACSGG